VGRRHVCVINYLLSRNKPGNGPGLRAAGVDSNGIKWSGETEQDEFSVREILDFGRGAEGERREIPEDRQRPLGWK